MTDTEIQRLAQQLAANNRALIIDEIDRRMRLPTGVVSGGPYGSFCVNDQGLITSAAVSKLLAWYRSTGTSVTHGDTRLDFDVKIYDPNNLVTTGASSWVFTAPNDGIYSFVVKVNLTTTANWSNGATAYALVQGSLTIGGLEQRVDKIFPRTGDANIGVFLSGEVLYDLVAGDTVYFTARQGSDSTPLVADTLSQIYISQR